VHEKTEFAQTNLELTLVETETGFVQQAKEYTHSLYGYLVTSIGYFEV